MHKNTKSPNTRHIATNAVEHRTSDVRMINNISGDNQALPHFGSAYHEYTNLNEAQQRNNNPQKFLRPINRETQPAATDVHFIAAKQTESARHLAYPTSQNRTHQSEDEFSRHYYGDPVLERDGNHIQQLQTIGDTDSVNESNVISRAPHTIQHAVSNPSEDTRHTQYDPQLDLDIIGDPHTDPHVPLPQRNSHVTSDKQTDITNWGKFSEPVDNIQSSFTEDQNTNFQDLKDEHPPSTSSSLPHRNELNVENSNVHHIMSDEGVNLSTSQIDNVPHENVGSHREADRTPFKQDDDQSDITHSSVTQSSLPHGDGQDLEQHSQTQHIHRDQHYHADDGHTHHRNNLHTSSHEKTSSHNAVKNLKQEDVSNFVDHEKTQAIEPYNGDQSYGVSRDEVILNSADIALHGAKDDKDYSALERSAIRRHRPTDIVGTRYNRMKVGEGHEPNTISGDMAKFREDEFTLQREYDRSMYEQMWGSDDNGSINKLNKDMVRLNRDWNSLCFTTGTMIKTTLGEKAVENLNIGDVAITASGQQKTIIWIGRQDVIFGAKDERPVTFKAGAIKDNVPYKNLTVSAAHGFAFHAKAKGLLGFKEKDILVRASALVNDTSIIQTHNRKATYWHIELMGGHDILIANGAEAESFADHGERAFFTNAHPHKEQNITKDCLPRMKRGKYVRAVKNQIDRRISKNNQKNTRNPVNF